MSAEVDLVSRMHGRFKGIGLVMPEPQRKIYEKLRSQFVEDIKTKHGYPKRITKPTVVDVGCGIGIGANILSAEAQFVWGIDSNPETVKFATQMFARNQDNVYYSPQLTFDVVDALNEPREMMRFDYIVCVEVIEHIPSASAEGLLKFLNRFVKKGKNGAWQEDEGRSRIYLTTPNRNSPTLQQDTPRNPHHCYEATAGELYAFFIQHYKYVTILNSNFEPVDGDTQDTPLCFKLEIPLHE